MLTIRRSQMQAMAQSIAKEFVETLREEILGQRPELAKQYSDNTIRETIRGAIERARRYGFSTKSALGRFTTLVIENGPGFDEVDHVQRLLLDATASERQRIEQTEQYLHQTASRSCPDAKM